MKQQSLFKAFLCFSFILVMASCATTHKIMLADVITFSDDAQASYSTPNKAKQLPPYVIYQEDEVDNTSADNYKANGAFALKKQLTNFDKLQGKNTAGYYAMDLGLDRVKYVKNKILKGDKQSKFYIIYITDGLDNISVQAAKNHNKGSYASLKQYIEKQNQKKKKLMGGGKDQQLFQIYPMVYLGDDLKKIQEANKMSDAQFKEWMLKNMEGFTGSSQGWTAPRPMLSENWDSLAFELKDKFTAASYEFYIPKGYLNKRIRMTLHDDHIPSHRTYIEGIYTKKGNKYMLRNVELKNGLFSNLDKEGSKNGGRLTNFSTILSFNNDDTKATESWFRIENLSFEYDKNNEKASKNYKVYTGEEKDFVPKQEYEDGGFWLYNSEYDGSALATVNTYILFIADVSSSLGTEGPKKESDLLVGFFDEITKHLRPDYQPQSDYQLLVDPADGIDKDLILWADTIIKNTLPNMPAGKKYEFGFSQKGDTISMSYNNPITNMTDTVILGNDWNTFDMQIEQTLSQFVEPTNSSDSSVSAKNANKNRNKKAKQAQNTQKTAEKKSKKEKKPRKSLNDALVEKLATMLLKDEKQE